MRLPLSLMTNSDSRILYFTRRPEIEARVKQLVLNPRQNGQVIRQLYHWVKSSIHASSIPFVELNETDQQGHSFGEKLANGVQALIDDGVSNIIVLGNDSPDLDASDLNLALEGMQEGSQVVGQSLSGGSWIIGIKAEHFEKDKFENLPWQTTALGAALTDLLESQSQVFELNSQYDLNDSETFLQLLNANIQTGFWTIIRRTLQGNCLRELHYSIEYQTLSITQPSLRAPPTISSL